MREEYKFLMPSLILCVAIVAFPTVFLLFVSFQRWVLFEPEVAFTGFGNFWSMISSSEFLESVRVTAIFVVSSTLVTLILGLALALILSERLRGRGLFRVAFTLPAIIPPVVAGFAWKFLLNSEIGVVGGYLLPLVGFEKSIYGDPVLALMSVIMADVWCRMPLMFLILMAGLQAIPDELLEAAEIDGANYWQLLKDVTLPLLKPVIIIALIIRFIDAFNLFEMILVMTSGGPGTATQTLPLLGWKTGFQYFNLGEAASLAVMMLLVTVLISQALIRRMRR